MSGFTGDPLWNQPALSYNVVAMATPALQQAVAPVLDGLSEITGAGALHLTPPAALHVSLYTVTPVRDRFDKHRYWAEVQQTVRRIVEDWSARHAPLTLHFRQLRVMPAAIVAVAESDDAVWALRRTLSESLPPPPTGAPRYDMIHMSLARYADAARLPADFAAKAAAIACRFDFRIDAVQLIRESIYPSLVYDQLSIHPLRAGIAA